MRAAGVSIGRLTWIDPQTGPGHRRPGFRAPASTWHHRADQAWRRRRRALAQNPGEAFTRASHGVWNREGNTFLHFNALEARPAPCTASPCCSWTTTKPDANPPCAPCSGTYHGKITGCPGRRGGQHPFFSSWETTRETRHRTLRWDTGITPEITGTWWWSSRTNCPLADLYRYSRYLAAAGAWTRMTTSWPCGASCSSPSAIGGAGTGGHFIHLRPPA